jgi:hypothetical protein
MAQSCHITTVVSVGRTVIARTGGEVIGAGSAGLLYFKLTPRGRKLLAHSRQGRLGVQVRTHEASGPTSTTPLSLIPFSSSGPAPRHAYRRTTSLRVLAGTDFVASGGTGAILVACTTAAPCLPTLTVTIGHTVIARTGRELVGGNEPAYLVFKLTGRGRTWLSRSARNQLGVRVGVTDAAGTASGTVALVGFS